jgi:hypothetical protein
MGGIIGSAVGGFFGNQAQGKRFDTARGELDQATAGFQNAGSQLQGTKYDPSRYAREKGFLQDRIAGGGITAKERKMQEEGDLRAGQSAAAARRAALEQMSRTGQGLSGSGAALASALAGGQSAMAAQSAANLEREASAANRLEQDIRRTTDMSREGTLEEANLANLKAQIDLAKAGGIGNIRSNLAGMQLQKGQQEGAAWGAGGDLVGGLAGGLLCFEEGTEFLMEDHSTKKIEDIKLGEYMAHGKMVTEIGQSFSTDVYDYQGIKVTGSHAVFEDGAYIRVSDSKHSKKINSSVPVRIYFLSNEKHIMISSNETVFSDNMEVDADISLEASLQILNSQKSIEFTNSVVNKLQAKNGKLHTLRRIK